MGRDLLMKLKIIATMALIAMLGLCGCASGSKESGTTQAKVSTGQETAAVSASAAGDMKDKRIIQPIVEAHEDSFVFDSKSTKTYKWECVYETISLDESSAKEYPQLDKALKDFSKEILNEQKKEIEKAKTDPDGLDGGYGLTEDHFYLDIIRADSEVFSIQTTHWINLGFPHGNDYVTGATFDSKTGERLEFSDVITSKENLIAIVKKYLLEEYGKESFTWDLDESLNPYLNNTEAELNWYLTQDGLCVSFDPYVLSSYMSGRYWAFLPFADYPELFKRDFKTSEGAFIYPTESRKKIDLDRDGKLESVGIRPDSFDNGKQQYTGIELTYDGTTCYVGNLSFMRAESVAVHTVDNKNYAYVFIGDNQGYTNTLIFELTGNHANYIGTFEGAMAMHNPFSLDKNTEKGEIKNQRVIYPIVNPESFVLQKRVGNSPENVTEAEYMVGEDGIPVVKQQ